MKAAAKAESSSEEESSDEEDEAPAKAAAAAAGDSSDEESSESDDDVKMADPPAAAVKNNKRKAAGGVKVTTAAEASVASESEEDSSSEEEAESESQDGDDSSSSGEEESSSDGETVATPAEAVRAHKRKAAEVSKVPAAFLGCCLLQLDLSRHGAHALGYLSNMFPYILGLCSLSKHSQDICLVLLIWLQSTSTRCLLLHCRIQRSLQRMSQMKRRRMQHRWAQHSVLVSSASHMSSSH